MGKGISVLLWSIVKLVTPLSGEEAENKFRMNMQCYSQSTEQLVHASTVFPLFLCHVEVHYATVVMKMMGV